MEEGRVHLIKRRIGIEGKGVGVVYIRLGEGERGREGPYTFSLLWLG